MKTIKVDELSGKALDWAVEKCGGVEYEEGFFRIRNYHNNWLLAGPIIEAEKYTISHGAGGVDEWVAVDWDRLEEQAEQAGPTPIIAALRLYVFLNLGEIVEVPDEV